MSSQVPVAELQQAIIRSVEHGAYPESEDISSAELTPSVLPALLTELQKARDEVKADISQLSRDIAPDVDGWIAQAKKLQADIERSKATARDIVRQAEEGRKLQDVAGEAERKAGLLRKEVTFNETLVETLGRIKDVKQILDDCQNAIITGNLPSALAAIKQVDTKLPKLAAVENTRAYDLVRKQSEQLKGTLAEQATTRARTLVHVSLGDHSLTISGEESGGMYGIVAAIDTLSYLGARHTYLQRLRRDLDSTLFHPRVSMSDDRLNAIRVASNIISVVHENGDSDIMSVLDDVWSILEFLDARLPATLCSPMSELLLPPLIENIITSRLSSCVPIEIDEMPFFQQVLDRVSKLADQIDTLHWSGSTAALKEWVQSAPRTWLAKRRETSLGAVRTLLFTKLKERNTVERVETQMVTKGDALMSGHQDGSDDAWDESWNEEPLSPVNADGPSPIEVADDEDDASAWDIDDDQPEQAPASEAPANENAAEDDVDADAWGWGDEEQGIQQEAKLVVDKKSHTAFNTQASAQPSTEREITLRETYTVTAVPDGILEIIRQSIADAETLTDSSYAHTPIGPAASALYTLPTFVLAMYRATASTAYGRMESGNILIYNDSMRLADQLRSFVTQQAEKDSSSTLATHLRPSSRLKLDNDITALDSFAKRAYSTEMESQRTILGDMLDGAQGFANCTVEPFASACESAVDITAGRLRDVHRQWSPVLSRSALLQSLGSLLGTVTSKMIMEIKDLSDIGDEESKKLRSCCDKLSGVRELFVQEHSDGGQSSDMTGIYCPNWFKFQYLSEILESSLADIKYLWTEGELRLEFSAAEVVDLIEALFADSDYRRKAIADIRRMSR